MQIISYYFSICLFMHLPGLTGEDSTNRLGDRGPLSVDEEEVLDILAWSGRESAGSNSAVVSTAMASSSPPESILAGKATKRRKSNSHGMNDHELLFLL